MNDWQRRESARRPKEAAAVDWLAGRAPGPDAARDDSLALLFLCCHPALPRPGQVALTLRAVGGLTTAEIARTYLVPEPTMARRITAVHDEATNAADTDWPQIVSLYRILERIAPSPVVTLNRAVAVGMADGPLAGLAVLSDLDDDPRLGHHHRLAAVRAHLLEMAGDLASARDHYHRAARATASWPERNYLLSQLARLG